MELSPEDSLRLNVLFANKPQAIRIDESQMTLHALTALGPASIPLNPTGRSDKYLKQVREYLSLQMLGTPTGYPLHLQRWTRMGQVQNYNLEALLCLGEPEAVVAVVYSKQLTADLASRAWWALEDAENARQLLRTGVVAASPLGRQLVRYLIDYLPFETEAEPMMDTVQLVLQSGLATEAEVADLWKKAKRKQALYVGFLAAGPSYIPEQAIADDQATNPSQEAAQWDGAKLMSEMLSASGQSWLRCLQLILDKPSNQHVVNRTLDIVRDKLAAARPEGEVDMELADLQDEAAYWAVKEAAKIPAGHEPQYIALRVLSGVGYGVVRPVFSKSDAIGTLMRQKIQPITDGILEQVNALLAH